MFSHLLALLKQTLTARYIKARQHADNESPDMGLKLLCA